MNNFHNQLPISGSVKFDPLNPTKLQSELTLDLSKLSPKWKIAISLGLLAVGIYQLYHSKEEKN